MKFQNVNFIVFLLMMVVSVRGEVEGGVVHTLNKETIRRVRKRFDLNVKKHVLMIMKQYSEREREREPRGCVYVNIQSVHRFIITNNLVLRKPRLHSRYSIKQQHQQQHSHRYNTQKTYGS